MSKKRILIVDDDRNIQSMLRTCLEGAGYATDRASDGAAALEMIQRQTPDLVLLDLAMPVMDGMTVLAETRSLLAQSGLRVIVMTAHGSVKTAMQAVRLGAADFLEKPFNPDDIRQSVASVLRDEVQSSESADFGYQAALESVREALRRGKFIAAEAALMKAGTVSDGDPSFLNLAGVLHEAHGRLSSARNFYRKALLIEPSYLPARKNLDRLDEFEKSGSTRAEVALGDGFESHPANASTIASLAGRVRELLMRPPGHL